VRLGHRVLLETSGSLDVSQVDARVLRIVDLKSPGSGEVEQNRWRTGPLRASGRDQVRACRSRRLRVGARRDSASAGSGSRRGGRGVLLSTAHGLLDPALVAAWLLEDRLPARLQLQLHKILWDPKRARGV